MKRDKMHLDEKCKPILPEPTDLARTTAAESEPTNLTDGQVGFDDPAVHAVLARTYFEAGEQAGITLGLTLARDDDYQRGYAAGWAALQAQIDADADWVNEALAGLARVPERNREDDRLRRDAAMIREGARQERERVAHQLHARVHRSVAA